MTTPKAVGRATKKCSSATSANRTTKKTKPSKLKRDTQTISASEVNRFTYCQYQWYYERVYGRTELGRMHRERNKNQKQGVRLKNTTENNFRRGREYHKQEYARYQRKQFVMAALTLALLIAAVLLFVMVRMR